MVKNNSFKLLFKDNNNQEIDLDYQLHDSILAEKWFKKIKHLKNIAVDNIESRQCDVSDLKKIYNEFCIFAEVDPIEFELIDQPLLNEFHKLYEETHEVLSKKQHNEILYKFHHSIHFYEPRGKNNYRTEIGWGTKEGPLTQRLNCNQYYENNIKKNNIYLSWSELGKKPTVYWQDKEPNNQKRFNQLCKPHITFRARFFIANKNSVPEKFNNSFEEWFNQYKDAWLAHHNIKKWDEIDEHSAPLLAVAQHNENIDNLVFKNFVIL